MSDQAIYDVTGDPRRVTFGALIPERDAAPLVGTLQTFIAMFDSQQATPDLPTMLDNVRCAMALLNLMGQPIELESPLAMDVPATQPPGAPTAAQMWRP